MGVAQDIRLSISANLAAYQRELSKMPGITDKQATRSALAMQRELVKAEVNAAKAATVAGKQAAKGFSGAFSGITLAITPTDILRASTAIVELGQRFADLRNQVADASARTGVATKTLAGLRLAAEGSGLAFENLEAGLNVLPKRLGDARKGSGEAAKALTELGLTQEDLTGKYADNDAALKEIVNRLQSVEDPSKRAELAVGAFGEAGGKMLQALGGTELDLFIAKADQWGVDTGPAATAAAGDFQRSMADLGLIVSGAASGVSDYLLVGQSLEALNVGLVMTIAALSQEWEQLGVKVTAASMALQGDISGAIAYYDEFSKTQYEMGEAVKASTQEWIDQLEQTKANKGSAEGLDAAIAALNDTTGAGTTATKANAAAQREAAQAERDRLAGLSAQDAAFKALGKVYFDETGKLLTGREAVDHAFQQELNTLADLRDAAKDRAGADIAYEMAVGAIREKYAARYEELDNEWADNAIENVDRVLEKKIEAQPTLLELLEAQAEMNRRVLAESLTAIQGYADAGISIIQDMNAKAQDELEKSKTKQFADVQDLIALREGASAKQVEAINAEIAARRSQGKDERKVISETMRKRRMAALVLFRAGQLAKLGEIAMSTALAAISLSPPPPLGLGPIGGPAFALLVGGGAAASVLAQKPPQFYTGTGRSGRQDPDQMGQNLHQGEGVVNARGMAIPGMGEVVQAVNRLGSRALQGGGQVVQAVISQRQVSQSMLAAAAGDGQLGALLGPQMPGYYPGLR